MLNNGQRKDITHSRLLAHGFYCSLLLGLLGFSDQVEARIYQYVDDQGRKVFVDRLSKVPAKYRDQLESRQEESERLSPDQVKQLQLQRKLLQSLEQIRLEQERIESVLKQSVTPFRFHHNRILLPVKVRYGSASRELSLVMDTGASSTVVHKNAVQALNAKLSTGSYARVADGSVVKTERIKFDQVEIGPYKIKTVQASVIDFVGASSGSDGLLGMDFLYNARYRIDRARQQIIWQPQYYQQLQERLTELQTMADQLQNPGKTEAP